jgi:hypothetical protein
LKSQIHVNQFDTHPRSEFVGWLACASVAKATFLALLIYLESGQTVKAHKGGNQG